jgi:NADH dehydrogenase FAD-containing subunit
MEKILIVGAGFAGLTAASILSRERSLFKVIVVDKKPTFDFLPMLPDVIGRGINSKFYHAR